METALVIGGIIIGYTISSIRRKRERVHGIVHIDHKTNQCAFSIRSDDLANPKSKIAVFVINHNAELSREEQTL